VDNITFNSNLCSLRPVYLSHIIKRGILHFCDAELFVAVIYTEMGLSCLAPGMKSKNVAGNLKEYNCA